MQYASTNPANGYALHKITGHWTGRASGYFAADGTLKDAEHMPHATGTRGGHISRPVKVGGPMWKAIQTAGRAYAQR